MTRSGDPAEQRDHRRPVVRTAQPAQMKRREYLADNKVPDLVRSFDALPPTGSGMGSGGSS
jgi:hypothetical protein